MKSLYRRQKQQYIFAALVGVVGMLNLLFFFILFRPAKADYDRLQQSIDRLRKEIVVRNQSVGRLQRLNEQLESSQQDRARLFSTRFVPRADGFAEILRHLENLAQTAGVLKSRVEYQIERIPKFGLYSVKIRMPLEGGYPNIVKFIDETENSEIFLIIDSIDVRSGGSSSSSTIELALNLETFFYE